MAAVPVVTVNLHSAKGLRSADWSLMGGSKSDPFCVCQVRGKPETKVQTNHIKKTLDPVWNEEHEIDDYVPGDLLEFKVLDYDVGKSNDSLGWATLSLEPGEDREVVLDLKDCGKGKKATITVKVTVPPAEAYAAPSPKDPISEDGSRVEVRIISASKLRAADWSLRGGASDPFCVCHIAGRPETAVETAHLEKNLNPTWDQQFIIDDYERGEDLEFQVMDYDKGSASDLLGKATLGAALFDHAGGFEGALKLVETGNHNKVSKLFVFVKVLGPLTPAAPPISEPGSRLEINVVSASGLRAADWSLVGSGTSDPYCTCYIVGKENAAFQTEHVNKTLDPVWNETHILESYEHGDKLLFQIWDYDRGSGADSLGKATLKCREFDREHGFRGELKLLECGKGKDATLAVTVQILPPARPPADAVSEPGSKLEVTLISASGLRAADWSLTGGKSDPFCVCEIEGRPDTKVQTKHINKTLNPEWSEQFVIEGYERGERLEFRVMDYDIGSGADLLGRVLLLGNEFDREDGFDGELKLSETGKAKNSKLKVQIKVLPPSRPPAPPVSQEGSRVQVKILSAAGLRAADWSLVGGSKSDPYCICVIEGKDDSKVQTRHINKTLEPEWNEEFILEDYDRGDNLHFQVMDHDVGSGDDSLGKVTLPHSEFDREDGFEGPLRLKESGKGQNAVLVVKIAVLGPVRPAAPPIWKPGSKLQVTVVKATGLRAADWALAGGSSDPFCAFEIVGRPETKTETVHISKTLDPVWNEYYIIDDYMSGEKLQFTVLDHDIGSGSDLLGRAFLPAREFDREDGFDGELKLKECGKDHRATLHVDVSLILPRPPAPPVSVKGSRLQIVMVEAHGLRAADGTLFGKSTSDPFCCCQIEGKPETAYQTRHISKTLDPAWNEEYLIEDYEQGQSLEFAVKDYDKLSAADLLGRVSLPCAEFDREDGFEGILNLKDCGKGKRATLQVHVNVLPPLPTYPPISEPGSRLRVLIARAKDLRSADWSITGGGKSDPYCICNIAGKAEEIFQTKRVDKTLEPTWNEEHIFEDFERGDNLEFHVKDYDKAKKGESLGRVALYSKQFDHKDGFAGDLKLKDCGKGHNATLTVQVQVLPPLRPRALRVSEPGCMLHIIILSATGLRGADLGGKSDPYCECQVQGKPGTKFQTKHKKKTLDPVWNSEHEIEDYEPDENLEFRVLDHGAEPGNDFLGRLKLLARDFDREDGFKGELKLKECGKGCQATLKIQVSVVPPFDSEPLMICVVSADYLGLVPQPEDDSHYRCTCKINTRPRSKFQTSVRPLSIIDDVAKSVWNEELRLASCCEGDLLEFIVEYCDRDGSSPQVFARAQFASDPIFGPHGYFGHLDLIGDGASEPVVASLLVRIEMVSQYEDRLLREQQEEAERLQREREAQELAERLAKEEEERRIREEKERLAREEEERRRQEARMRKLRATDITVPLHIAPSRDRLADLHMKFGNTVLELQKTAFRVGKLPLRPRLSDLASGKKLELPQMLLECDMQNGQEVLAEVTAILTTSRDKTCRIWNATTGECVCILEGHEGAVISATTTNDLSWIITCSADQTAKVWAFDPNAEKARCTWTLRGHEGAVNSAAFSPDRKWIATASADCTAKIWSMKTGICSRTLEGHNGELLSVAFEPDPKSNHETTGTPETFLMRTKGSDDPRPQTKIFEAKSGIVLSTEAWELPPKRVPSMSPDGKLKVVPTGDPIIEVCDVQTGRMQEILEGHKQEVLFASFVALGSKGGYRESAHSPRTGNELPQMRTLKRADTDAARELSASCGNLSRYIKPQRKELQRLQSGGRSNGTSLKPSTIDNRSMMTRYP